MPLQARPPSHIGASVGQLKNEGGHGTRYRCILQRQRGGSGNGLGKQVAGFQVNFISSQCHMIFHKAGNGFVGQGFRAIQCAEIAIGQRRIEFSRGASQRVAGHADGFVGQRGSRGGTDGGARRRCNACQCSRQARDIGNRNGVGVRDVGVIRIVIVAGQGVVAVRVGVCSEARVRVRDRRVIRIVIVRGQRIVAVRVVDASVVARVVVSGQRIVAVSVGLVSVIGVGVGIGGKAGMRVGLVSVLGVGMHHRGKAGVRVAQRGIIGVVVVRHQRVTCVRVVQGRIVGIVIVRCRSKAGVRVGNIRVFGVGVRLQGVVAVGVGLDGLVDLVGRPHHSQRTCTGGIVDLGASVGNVQRHITVADDGNTVDGLDRDDVRRWGGHRRRHDVQIGGRRQRVAIIGHLIQRNGQGAVVGNGHLFHAGSKLLQLVFVVDFHQRVVGRRRADRAQKQAIHFGQRYVRFQVVGHDNPKWVGHACKGIAYQLIGVFPGQGRGANVNNNSGGGSHDSGGQRLV